MNDRDIGRSHKATILVAKELQIGLAIHDGAIMNTDFDFALASLDEYKDTASPMEGGSPSPKRAGS